MTEVPPRSAKPARARSLACPNCGSAIEIRASGISISAACPSCGAVLDVSTETVRLIAEAQARTRSPAIPIGWRGPLAGTEWQVVGYQVRSSELGSWVWEEYLLFNPYRGFRFLGQDHGHWTLYGVLRHDIGADGTDPADRRHYRPQEEVIARTDYVLGEFYWRVRVGDTVNVREFAAAPFLLAREGGGDEVTWSRGIYLEPAVVQAAFGLRSMPPRQGVAPHQPIRMGKSNWPAALLALFALFFIAVFLSGPDAGRLVVSRSFTMTVADQDRTLPAIAFDLPGAAGNLEVNAAANAKGGALRFEVSIAGSGGTRHDTSFQFGNLIGGGTQTADATFASVTGGAYTLLVKPHSSLYEGVVAVPWMVSAPTAPGVPSSIAFTMALHRHVPDVGSIVLAVFAILIWPVCVTIFHWLRRIGNTQG